MPEPVNDLADQLRRRVAALRPDWNPADLSGFLYLEGGYSNDNYRFSYRGERYVLRAPYRHRGSVDRHLEHHVYRTPAGIGTPELIAFDPASGDMISRWVAGALLADSTSDPDSLADYLSRLHAGLPDIERDYDPLAQAREHLNDARAPDWLERLAATSVWQPVASATCHNDLNPWNVIRTPGGDWITLDWEWVGRNDPLFDLVTLHQGAGLDEDLLSAMAGRYLGAAPDPERLRRCLIAFWLRETTWALAEIAHGNDRPEVVAQRDLGLARLQRLR